MRPRTTALSFDFIVGFTICKEKIVEDNEIEVFRRMFGYLLHLLAVFGVAVAERLKIIHFVDSISDAAVSLHAMLLEEFLGLLQRLARHDFQVAVCFQIDLVHLHLRRNDVPRRVQPLQVAHFLHFVGTGIHRHLEALIISGIQAEPCRQQQRGQYHSFHKDRVLMFIL
nr:hypothetical protein [uncultured Bacteroides sp.]